MERKLIKRAPEDNVHLNDDDRTVWSNGRPENDSCWLIHEGKVYMHCAGVYGYSLLTNHSIDQNGEVNASVLCTDGTGNEYHEFVILEDWPKDIHKVAGEEEPQVVLV